ncbi:sensor histidine kinase [Kordia jejudonensis]|uniref:sensor histidine kinase n=1 Tax=Kordia jejudonensis TaxID=1348245 RepID=UPI000629B72D|nr:histidine kinase [Kordia jejudonensis]
MYTSRIVTIAGHLLFWAFNYWLVAFGSDLNWNGFSAGDGSLVYAYSYSLLFNAMLFYTQVFWLFPKIYQQQKKILFYILSIIIVVGVSIIESYGDRFVYEMFAINKPYLCGFISNIMVHCIYVIAGFYYAIQVAFKKSEKLKQQLLEETYKTELKYLKAQLNPHFLFNGMNNIYHLIGKDNALAKETLHQFSDLLRYQLYESNAHILLEKELDYISKYIQIEKTNRGDDIRLEYIISSENPTLKIAPLLLIPFVENAFKHCSNHIDNDANMINIKIEEVDRKVQLHITNSYDEFLNEDVAGGIGLANVKKRLSILYKNRHQLTITKDKNIHNVHLIISL